MDLEGHQSIDLSMGHMLCTPTPFFLAVASLLRNPGPDFLTHCLKSV